MSLADDGFEIHRGAIPVDLVERVRVDAYARYEAGNLGPRGSYALPGGPNWHITNVHRDFESVRALLPHLPNLHVANWKFLPGEPLAIVHSKFSFKKAGEAHRWYQHQDAAYKPEPRRGVGVAVLLEYCSLASGTIEFFRGSHRSGLLPHRHAGEKMRHQVEIESPLWTPSTPFNGNGGDIALFSLYTVHESGPNRLEGLRAILFLELEPWTESLRDDAGAAPEIL